MALAPAVVGGTGFRETENRKTGIQRPLGVKYPSVRLTHINPAGRAMVPIVCPLKFVQGFRCSRCPWTRLLPDCHVAWALPVCETRCVAEDFKQHTCTTANDQKPFLILQ